MEEEFISSAIVPVQIVDGHLYILLGYECRYYKNKKKMEYHSLGGHREKNETSMQTAIREFYEESNQIFPYSFLIDLLITSQIYKINLYQLTIYFVYMEDNAFTIPEKHKKSLDVKRNEDASMDYLKWFSFDNLQNQVIKKDTESNVSSGKSAPVAPTESKVPLSKLVKQLIKKINLHKYIIFNRSLQHQKKINSLLLNDA